MSAAVSPVERADTLVALLARELGDGDVVATGVASPLAILAIAVARATHAPRLTYLSCVGSLDPEIVELHASTSEDLRYLDGRSAEVSIPDLFDHARRGRIDTVFFGAVEVDAEGRTNMSAAGDLAKPKVKFPGLAGASSLRRWVRKPVLVVPRQTKRALVSAVQVASTSDERRTLLVTDLGVFDVGPGGAVLASRHAWATEDEIASLTGFAFRAAEDLPVTPSPDARTRAAIHRIDRHDVRLALVG